MSPPLEKLHFVHGRKKKNLTTLEHPIGKKKEIKANVSGVELIGDFRCMFRWFEKFEHRFHWINSLPFNIFHVVTLEKKMQSS